MLTRTATLAVAAIVLLPHPFSRAYVITGDDSTAVPSEHVTSEGRKFTLLLPPRIEAHAVGSVPLLFAVHCFGCVAADMLSFAGPAQRYGFALALPEESRRGAGFAALECCGESQRGGVDDLGNLRRIADQVAALHPAVSLSAVFGTGWSNGGFLVAADALAAAREGTPRLFAAIAPIAGFQYDAVVDAGGVGKRGRAAAALPLPVLLFHSEDDPLVKFGGCCNGHGGGGGGGNLRASRCCCRIGAARDACVGTPQVLAGYGALNRCATQLTPPPSPPSPLLQASLGLFQATTVAGPGGFRCMALAGCAANATLCAHPGGLGHFAPFKEGFPRAALDAVGDFFAREACVGIGAGSWDSARKECTCPRRQRHTGAQSTAASGALPGRYCLARGS